ncbi:MAG: tRNA uracil 4-sulfurtransferase ThiI [Clostridia bacterium]
MKEIILIKLGEIVLKGLNKRAFEELLIKNIKRRISPNHEYEIWSAQSTIYVSPLKEDLDLYECAEKIGKIFGIVAYVQSAVCEKNLDEIKKCAEEYLEEDLMLAKTFKVESKRSDKKFPLTSPKLSAEVGGYLLEKYPHLKVDVKKPEVTVWVEVRERAAYIHSNAKQGAGGIPVGCGGKAAILISGGIDSPVAAWMLARRGVELTAIHFASPPYTSERAHDKVVRLLKAVSSYSGRMKMITVNFTKIQEEIRDKCQDELSTVIMRRFMMRVSQKLARKNDCSALITGESLGQVASQTIQAIACTDAVANIPVFRPLIGTDKSEIVTISQKIGTFDISIEPFEDCCTVFTPKHPRTKPNTRLLEMAEQNLDVDALVEDAIQNIEIINI